MNCNRRQVPEEATWKTGSGRPTGHEGGPLTWNAARLRLGGSVAAAALAVLGGCAGQGNVEDGNAEAAAVAFSQSIETATARACGLLAPQTLQELEAAEGPCGAALPEQLQAASGQVESTEVYGKDALVRLSTDVIFLARFNDGWRVTAAGCTKEQDGRPYDCKVKGA